MPFTLDSKGNTSIEVDSLRASLTGGSDVYYIYGGSRYKFQFFKYGQSKGSAWETGWIPIGAETSDNITTLIIVYSYLTDTNTDTIFPNYQAIDFAADTGLLIGLHGHDGTYNAFHQENGWVDKDTSRYYFKSNEKNKIDQFMSKFSYIFEPKAGLQSVLIIPGETIVNEGEILTATVATTYVDSGTTLYYLFSGSGITTADISSGTVTGSGIVGTDGKLSISLALANDLTTEGIETLNIKLFSDAARTTQIGQAATVSIVDTSPTPTSLNHVSVAATANGKETDGSPVVFTFTRSGSTAAALSVNYQLFGTAKAGSDYTGNTSGSVSFAAGSSTAMLSLPALADGALIDPYETIIARINPATNYEIAAGKQFATATITAEGMVVVPKGQPLLTTSRLALLKSDGSVFYSLANTGNATAELTGVTQIYSNGYAFAALKLDGSVISWNDDGKRGGVAPAGLTGVSQIFSSDKSFAALKNDGTVVCWGSYFYQGQDGNTELFNMLEPSGLSGVIEIVSTLDAFTALKSDGTVVSWGAYFEDGKKDDYFKMVAPTGLTGVSEIFSNDSAFAALKSDGSVVSWGNSFFSGVAPAGLTGVSQIISNSLAFVALKSDGTIVSWGIDNYPGGSPPAGLTGVSQIFASSFAFAALKNDGSVVSWGVDYKGRPIIAPAGLTGVSQIFSSRDAFAALKSDGSVVTWGNIGNAPAELRGVTQIFAGEYEFVALKSDGSVVGIGGSSWSINSIDVYAGLTGVVGFNNPYTDDRLILEDKTTPTYTLTPSTTTINESAILTTSVATTNVASGTLLYYLLSGIGITTSDFYSGALTGSGAVGTDGKLSITHTFANDLTTEGSETLNIKLFSDSSRSTQVGTTASVTIADTSVNPFNLDIDGDGKVTALGDGLMVIRKLFGAAFAGDALTNKAISPTATRTTAEIHEFIQQGITAGLLDVDKDGKTTALGDGLMVIRHLFGAAFAGAALTNKAISPDSPYFGTPANFAAVAANIDAIKVIPALSA